MNVGSRTNACQPPELDRKGKAPGVDPCAELESRAGVWSFDANKAGQHPSDGTRFATGMRNSVSLTVNPRDHTLWATMHGRDQLNDWGFSDDYSAENPGEQVNHILKGDDFGWPYCYYSTEEKKLVNAPEYGGDGKQDSRCTAQDAAGVRVSRALGAERHDVLHGLAVPGAVQGRRVRRVPRIVESRAEAAAGLPRGVPADEGRQGRAVSRISRLTSPNAGGPGKDGRLHRPTGLAQGTDGSLYVADDVGGTIYKVSYKGK